MAGDFYHTEGNYAVVPYACDIIELPINYGGKFTKPIIGMCGPNYNNIWHSVLRSDGIKIMLVLVIIATIAR